MVLVIDINKKYSKRFHITIKKISDIVDNDLICPPYFLQKIINKEYEIHTNKNGYYYICYTNTDINNSIYNGNDKVSLNTLNIILKNTYSYYDITQVNKISLLIDNKNKEVNNLKNILFYLKNQIKKIENDLESESAYLNFLETLKGK